MRERCGDIRSSIGYSHEDDPRSHLGYLTTPIQRQPLDREGVPSCLRSVLGIVARSIQGVPLEEICHGILMYYVVKVEY